MGAYHLFLHGVLQHGDKGRQAETLRTSAMFTTPNRKSVYNEIDQKGDLTASKHFPELSHGNNRRPTRWIRLA